VPLDEAFDLLRSHARTNNLKLATLAHHIVTGTLTAPDLTTRA